MPSEDLLPVPEGGTAQPIDESMKALLRSHPGALFRLARHPIDPARVRMEDTAINIPEMRADQVYIVSGSDGNDVGAIYIEYQLQPRLDRLATWFTKAGTLHQQLGLPVALVVVYLEQGDRVTFPDHYSVEVAGFSTRYEFTALRLWEHADRIRSGELWELAPLLVLCENNPNEVTLREEVAIITRSTPDASEQAELFAIALRVAGRKFARGLVEAIFREELPMAQGATIIDDWIAEGEARGEARGRMVGREEEARRLLREALRLRFGAVPETLDARIEAADVDACEALFRKAVLATTLDEVIH